MCADDTTIFFTHTSLDALFLVANSELSKNCFMVPWKQALYKFR